MPALTKKNLTLALCNSFRLLFKAVSDQRMIYMRGNEPNKGGAGYFFMTWNLKILLNGALAKISLGRTPQRCDQNFL